MKIFYCICSWSIALFLSGGIARAETVWLDDLNLDAAVQGWGQPHKNASVDGHPLKINGEEFSRGFGTHCESTLDLKVDGKAERFTARAGVDDEINDNPHARVEFSVIGDGKVLWKSGPLRYGNGLRNCDVPLKGVKRIVLQVDSLTDSINFAHVDWVDAKFEVASGTTLTATPPPSLPRLQYVLTPPEPATPRINGPNVFGVRPGSPFLYTIPATGDRPLKFSASKLPSGLNLDSKTGRITGMLTKRGEYTVILHAKNARGQAEKKFRIVCGDQIALTPPMGWNSWNCFAHAVSQDKVERAARAMVSSGLINHGWSYINVDDFWQNHRDSQDPTLRGKFRDEHGFIVPNSRFPNMKGMADTIHGMGLKAGLYSSPGPWTCGGCASSWEHERQDAQTYAQWGFDYLKYDWCSYGGIATPGASESNHVPAWPNHDGSDEGAIYPYKVMGNYLREQNRDIVFSLCQYGMADVQQWGGAVKGNCWRTTGDITDTWRSMSHIGFNQGKVAPFSRPGNWNDPDMLIVGEVGWGNLHPTALVPDEQYTHISLWCLLSAPLLIGCDMEKLDAFTLNLLGNDEVLAIDQDALGKAATCLLTNTSVRVYVKELEDGGHAVGFFNLDTSPVMLEFRQLEQIGLIGKLHVRDLWRQKNLPDIDSGKDALSMTIPGHGVMLYKLISVEK